MYGYDSLAGSNVVSIAEFRKDFGYEYGNECVVSADWQLGFQAATFGGKFSLLLSYIKKTG
jgi:hypothetical protein